MCVILLLYFVIVNQTHTWRWLYAGTFYSWVTTLLPFLPQQFDENDDSELSESQMYVAEGQRVVNRAIPRSDAGEMSAVLLNNLAHYTPSHSMPTGALHPTCCVLVLAANFIVIGSAHFHSPWNGNTNCFCQTAP